jgi:hypothetical protein
MQRTALSSWSSAEIMMTGTWRSRSSATIRHASRPFAAVSAV